MLDNKVNSNFVFERITTKYYNDVIEHLRKSFFSDEPLNKAVNLCSPGDGHPLLECHSLSTLKDGLSVMALSKDGEVINLKFNIYYS